MFKPAFGARDGSECVKMPLLDPTSDGRQSKLARQVTPFCSQSCQPGRCNDLVFRHSDSQQLIPQMSPDDESNVGPGHFQPMVRPINIQVAMKG
ncbi:hypothetical protein V1279_001310 [Bradyrhizobium sp. AZCC 1610]|uniref:hypothetical protein n=1 Tax=Bradyrhizobium sp. AZCC 1610 TaxID=3117020 RepID=UPI002FEF0D3C